MTFENILRILLRVKRDPSFRVEILARCRQKISSDGFFLWLWRGITKRLRPLVDGPAVYRALSNTTAQDYIMSLRVNHAPNPRFHQPRTRPSSQVLAHGSDLKFIAYYLPQFHPFATNNAAWGEGFTEWTNTTKALPQYKGHYQPHLPADLGHYDLRLPDVMRQQIEMAKAYGVHGFCFHYYWFDGQMVMDLPLKQFLAHPDMDQSFCICWANENWTRRWDGMESDVILRQDYTHEKCLQFIQDLLPVLKDPRYILVEGRPLVVIYRPLLIPQLQEVVRGWREAAIEAGLPGLWLVCAQTFGLDDPRPIGFDAAVEFPPHKINDRIEDIRPPDGLWNPKFKGTVWAYADAVGEALTRDVQPYPLYRCAFPSWDNEARKPGAGYSFAQASPPQFGEWLATCASYARETRSASDNFVFVNAWNEWAEGAHLEPDRHFGYAWLEQVALQACKPRSNETPRLSYGLPITTSATQARVAVIIHLYYEDTWPEIAEALQALDTLSEPFDLIVTTVPEKYARVQAQVKNDFAQAEIHAVENKGRDIRPFMAVLPLLLHRQYKAVLKLHSKKSLHRMDGDLWREKLIANLLPRGPEMQTLVDSLSQYPSLGLIAPEGNVLNLQRYIGSNQAWVERLVIELGESSQWLEHSRPWFAAGTMFWLKPQALQNLLNCPSIQEDAFEEESGQIDSTLAHAIERVIGCATLASGYHLIDTKLAPGIAATDAGIRRQAQKKWASEWSYKGRQRVVDSPFARPTEAAT